MPGYFYLYEFSDDVYVCQALKRLDLYTLTIRCYCKDSKSGVNVYKKYKYDEEIKVHELLKELPKPEILAKGRVKFEKDLDMSS